MQPIAYIFFKDQCRAAMSRYGEIFGTTPEIMTFSDMPAEDQAQMPGVSADAVMHCALPIGEGWLYASDDPFGEPPVMSGCNVSISLPDEAETRRVWDALADGAEVRMELGPESWAPLFGTLTDRFGIRWMVMCDGPAP